MPVFNQTPPPQPNPGDPYDSMREVTHIQASKDSQDVVQGIYDYLDQFPPTLINDAVTGLLYLVLAQPAGNGIPLAIPALALQPGSDVSTSSDPKYTITYGTYGGVVPTNGGTALVPSTAANIITLGSGDQTVYIQCDFTYDISTGIVTIIDAEIKSATSAAFSALTSSVSSGTGVLYQELFGVTITAPVGSGPYTVVAAPAVGGSQNFGVCLAGPSISGPWGV